MRISFAYDQPGTRVFLDAGKKRRIERWKSKY
jgi:hypothetical protein